MNKFDEFWQSYPNRKGKGAAAKKYEKIDVETHKSILLAIDAQKRHRQAAKKTGEFMPEWCMPATWLNQQRWLDEIPSAQDTAEKVSRGTCSIEGCQTETYGNRFSLCEHHIQFDKNNRLRTSLRLVPELREHYLKHPGIHNLRGKPAVEYIKNCIRGMLK
jgi:hypothetical protein